MFYAYLAFGVSIDHPSIRPTVFKWSLAVCADPLAGSDSGTRKNEPSPEAGWPPRLGISARSARA
jgi:hypothetical protein